LNAAQWSRTQELRHGQKKETVVKSGAKVHNTSLRAKKIVRRRSRNLLKGASQTSVQKK